ncbi:MAG: recombinase RecT [Smithellaceae bacterium]|nr:recombinase RecT [Smithellaceae bacterium]
MAAQNLPATQERTDVSGLLSSESVKKRFEQVLGKKAAGFMSSVISAVNANNELKKAAPMTVIAAAAVAASLDLPINPSLGFAHIVPYRKDGIPIAQFQMGWRGYVQLGMRSGQYKTMNACVVYEGELVESNRFTGEMYFDENKRTSDKVIGYVAFFKLVNGFEKYLYMTVDQVTAHGKRYSKSFDNKNGKWQTDFEAMALKTVLKLLLSKFGILSIEMQNAVVYDQAAIKTIDGASYEYIDGTGDDAAAIDVGAEKTPEQISAEFDATIPAGTDPAALSEFIEATAKRNNATGEAVKAEAVMDPAAFWKIFAAYLRTKKGKKENKKEAPADVKTSEALAPNPCPNNPDTTYTKAYCDACAKRGGCPAWN